MAAIYRLRDFSLFSAYPSPYLCNLCKPTATGEVIISNPRFDPTLRAKAMIELLRYYYYLPTLKSRFGVTHILSLETIAHKVTQRVSANSGFVPCGMFLGWLPQGASMAACDVARLKLEGARFRGSFTVSCLPMVAPLHPVHRALPEAFRCLQRRIYEDFSMVISEVSVSPAAARTTMTTVVDEERGRAFFYVQQPGTDDRLLIEGIDAVSATAIEMVHVYLPL